MTVLIILLSVAAATIGVYSEERVPRQIIPSPVPIAELDRFQTLPRRALVKPGGKITLLGNAGVPLQSCLFYLPWPRSKWSIDFSLGPASNSTDRYEYFGRGLEFGDCGMRMKRVADDDDGIILCEVLAVGSDGPDDWERCATTLRVTNVRDTELPVFNIEPNRNLIKLARGDHITIKCNADRPINMCHIYLPGPRFLNMDNGPNSTATEEYRYHGNGLDKGECGATLTGVDERLSGYVVCKVGSWPETVQGKWETDSFQVITKEVLTTPIREQMPNSHANRTANATSCPPLFSKSVNISCFFAGKPTNCKNAQRIRAVAYMECKPGYVIPSWVIYRKITCLKGGVWDPTPITCQPDCGKRNTNEGAPFIANGTDSTIGEFPWHIGIYQLTQKRFLQMCGGTLISPGVIISAAHCFWDNNQQTLRSASIFRVAAGKHIRRWNKRNPWAQKREVLEIIVPKDYRGRGTNFKSDIAIVRVKVPFEITNVVNLACIDWNHDYDQNQLVAQNEGLVTGWGFNENGSQSDILQYVGLPYQPRESCIAVLKTEFQPLLTEDKFCAGFLNEGKSVCRGDSGGGLVFLEPRSNRFYLRGVVSIAFISSQGGVCNTQDYTGFTHVEEYYDWVLDNLYYDYGKIKQEDDNSIIVFPKDR